LFFSIRVSRVGFAACRIWKIPHGGAVGVRGWGRVLKKSLG